MTAFRFAFLKAIWRLKGWEGVHMNAEMRTYLESKEAAL